jgi:hypothetical protein
MPPAKAVSRTFPARETVEGAGVRLHRAFGYDHLPLFDPFLMLDDFRADDPADYLAGFPWHPHRGIETVTYMLDGRVEHRDSLGHSGSVEAGGVQWMTAGSGIIHQEMPKPVDGRMGGFQLWVNLPRSHKMIDPRYQEVPGNDIPIISPQRGVRIRVISGTIGEVTGPVQDIVGFPEFLDVTLGPDVPFSHEVRAEHTAAAYVIGGSGNFDLRQDRELPNRTMVLFGQEGRWVHIIAGNSGVRFLYFSGKPLKDPVAWRGPIVMNTEEEIRQAFDEYRKGTFLRKHG